MRVERAVQLALALLMVAVAVQIGLFGDWVVEDAAISFAYARNLAEGHGLVPFPGGERVEGYSNPTWVALLALGQLLGLNPFVAVKALALGFTAGTVPLVYRLAARAVPSAPVAAGLVAATAFAAHPQVAIFGAAGLENPLVDFLLALAILAAAREVEAETPPRWPPSAVWWLLLSLSRPETLGYAAVGGACTMAGHLRAGRGLGPTVRWLAVFWVPFLAWHGLRFAYFAWPFPMTYYAKVGTNTAARWGWGGTGWRYLGQYGVQTGHVWFLPLIAAGAGARGSAMVRLQAVGALLGALAFTVHSGGDWMEGYRWLTMAAVPGSVLLGAGTAAALAVRSGRPWLQAAAAAGVLIPLVGLDLRFTRSFRETGEVSPWDVRRRVERTVALTARMHLDKRPSMLTVDMGAYMWWSGMELYDMVGLTDVAFAQAGDHRARLIDQYVLGEATPDLVNLPGDSFSAFRRQPRFHELYVVESSVCVRRDLLFDAAWPEETVELDDGVAVGLPVVTSPEVAPGDPLWVEVGVRDAAALPLLARLELLDDAEGTLAAWDIDLGYRYHPPTRWRGDDWFHGRYAVVLPPDLPPGTYGLRVRIAGPSGELRPDEGALWTAHAVRVVPPDDALAAAEADRSRVFALAAEARCDDAEDAWLDARRHRLGDPAWAEEHRGPVQQALARCWVESAPTLDRGGQHAALGRARRLGPTDPVVRAAIDAAADRLEALAERAVAQGQQRAAHRAYREAVELDPTRSWDRRRAEKLRPVVGR